MNHEVTIDMQNVMTALSAKRQIFVSEADLQLEMAWIIKELYPEAKVRLEYTPLFDLDMHIDILVFIDNFWIPIELKYKTKGCFKHIDNEIFNLKNHAAKDVNCYLYLKDIQRIESIKANVSDFIQGYTVFITNDLSYTKRPQKDDCIYKDFSLEQGIIKHGTLSWAENTGEGTKKNCEEPIVLKNEYKIDWKPFSKVDDSNTGTFVFLMNTISK